MTSAFVQTVKVNGFTGLWRGLTANLLKVRKFLISEFYKDSSACFKVHLNPKYFFRLNKSLHLFEAWFAFLNLILTSL